MRTLILSLFFALSLAAQLPVRTVDRAGETVHAEPAGTKYVALMQVVPNSTTVLTATTTKVQLILCNNQTGSAATLTITDGSGTPKTYFPTVSIAANSVVLLYSGIGFTMTSGLKWSAGTATAIYCQIEGVQ
jgi:hypothetical protein